MEITSIDKNTFDMIVDYGKKLKSTLTVVDTTTHAIYGFNAIVNEDVRRYSLACLKYINNLNSPDIAPNILDKFNRPINLVGQTKGFTAMAKEPGNTGMDIYYDEMNGRIVPRFFSRGNTTIPTFEDQYLRNAYLNLLTHSKLPPLVDNMELTDYEPYQQICAMKAADGGSMINIDKYTFFMIGNILGVNKGDKSFISIYPESPQSGIVHFKIMKPKKKYQLNVMYRILLLNV